MRFDGTPCTQTPGCTGVYEFWNYCGAYVCTVCGAHRGLARCYCGWNLAPGEVLEDDVGVD